MHTGADPYAVLGVPRGASDADIHAAYRAAVRRTHPDAGGSAQAFEAVQDAYEALRDPARRPGRQAGAGARPASGRRPASGGADRPPAPPPADRRAASAAMEDLLAEAARLEEEARRLAGTAAPRAGARSDTEPQDSIGAVLRDAGTQLRDVAGEGIRELRRIARRLR